MRGGRQRETSSILMKPIAPQMEGTKLRILNTVSGCVLRYMHSIVGSWVWNGLDLVVEGKSGNVRGSNGGIGKEQNTTTYGTLS